MFDKVREILADQFEIDNESITENTKIIEDLKADSLDIAELIIALEEEFDIVIDDESIRDIKTVGDVIELLEKYTK